LGSDNIGEILDIRKRDFLCNFDTTNLSVGGSTDSGDTGMDVAYELDNDSVMELAGIELIGPVTAGGVRQPIESVEILIDGSVVDDIVFNDLMAPAWNAATVNQNPFFGGNGRLANQRAGFCFNLGVPLLMGGDPISACPKIGPKETLGFRVKAPKDAENGVTVDEDMIIRASVVEAKTREVVERVLGAYGTASGGNVEQSFEVVNMGNNDSFSVSKSVPLDLNMWTSLYGGQAAAKPYVTNYITYAKNAIATATNTSYQFTRSGRYVLHDFMDLSWNFDRTEAVQVTHVGVSDRVNLKQMRMYVSGRETPGNEWHVVTESENMFPMPLSADASENIYVGPAELAKPELIYNQKAYLELMDDGTSIPAWASGVTGAMIAVWGKKFELVV